PSPTLMGGGFWVGLDPHGPAERTYRFRKNDSGRLGSRISSSVIIIPEIWRQQRLEEQYDRGAAFSFSLPPTSRWEAFGVV
ncbi:hypothetical protein ACFW1P_31625, partial [Paenibacillus sp. NPDC058910]|uniref:hypothetical protein n=1 Tax=Paenibacillus sp. NPDC058910 TaxID=3346670 RepID=UPI00367432B7